LSGLVFLAAENNTMEVRLVVLSGKQKDREIPLPRTAFVIGRDTECHLRVHSPLVSRRHCTIACWSHKVTVRDHNSANGTLVNDERVTGEVMVHNGDRLQIGPLTFGFRFKESPPEEVRRKILRGSFRWLADQAKDAPPLDASGSTVLDPMPEVSEDGASNGAPGKVSVSLGTYLKKYL
jgi:predicted component of type VI protein secretion system